MSSLLKWIQAKFQHPVILGFLILGVVFLGLGFLHNINLPWLDEPLDLEDSLRTPCMLVGGAFIFLAVLLMYYPPAGWSSNEGWGTRTNENAATLAESPDASHGTRESFYARRMSLSNKQKRILCMIEHDKKLTFNAIKTDMSFENDSELYYRLEQLHLLGFVEKEKLRESSNSTVRIYKLAEPYAALLGDAEPDETGIVAIT